MVDLTNESDKREVGVPALEQVYGKSVARAAKRQRNARLGMTSEDVSLVGEAMQFLLSHC